MLSPRSFPTPSLMDSTRHTILAVDVSYLYAIADEGNVEHQQIKLGKVAPCAHEKNIVQAFSERITTMIEPSFGVKNTKTKNQKQKTN